MKLDAKFYGEIRKVKDDSLVPDDEYVVFLAKDEAFADTIYYYRDRCIALGADREQIDAVNRMIQRIEDWRANNPSRLKVPDANGEKLLDRALEPKS
jgi:hypothetical protein